MILSILTITFQDRDGLYRTRDSLRELLKQAGHEVEWLIQDGGSPYYLNAVTEGIPNADLVSEEDDGLYDAMNRALQRSRGEWVWMLNGGDECMAGDWEVLRRELQAGNGRVLLYDFCQVFGRRVRTRRARPWKDLSHALPTSHQAMIFPGDASRQIGYSTDYLAGDYHHAAVLKMNDIDGIRMGRTIARFHVGGESTQHVRQVSRDARRIQRNVLLNPRFAVMTSQARHAAARARLRFLMRGTA